MKKVGIITFHDTYNYGAALQAYAVQEVVKEMGYQGELIDYSMFAYANISKGKKVIRGLKRIPKVLGNLKMYMTIYKNEADKKRKKAKYVEALQVRNNKFKAFHKDYFQTNGKRYDSQGSLKEDHLDYDGYICGSDQIWNPNFCDNDANYYLQFAPREKRIAYAPSFGVSEMLPDKAKLIGDYIREIPYLSIREQNGASIIKALTGLEATVVVDPTQLISSKKWEALAKMPNADKPYILCYFIGDDHYMEELLERVKVAYPKYEIYNLRFDYCDIGPLEFIGLIRGAECVMTNSYHGLMFSLIFEKSFLVLKTLKDYAKTSGFQRIQYILEKLGQEERIINDQTIFSEALLKLDYTELTPILESQRKASKIYLQEALQKVVGDV